MKKNRLVQATIVASAAIFMVACGSSKKDDKEPNIEFTGVSAPVTDADKRLIYAAKATVDGKQYGGTYRLLARSGREISGIKFGQLVNENGTVLKAADGSARISDSNEFTSLLPVGDKLFSVSQFESRPGAMFLLELNQNKADGHLSVKSMKQIDQSGVDGGWVHCAGSVTPWTTHLASEEYEPNARSLVTNEEAAKDKYSKGMLDYYSDAQKWNPYFYGWNIEVTVNKDAKVTSTKHYAMGRLAFELSYVMPDEKTVYMTDDGTNVGLYMFIADKAKDLSAGTLYAAKWTQTSASGAGAANLSWVKLGHASDSEIKDYVKGTNGKTVAKFADIFETADPAEGKCASGFTSINAGGNKQECLKLKSGMEKVASRLETRRYAAMKGASTEFRKEEGITFDSKRNKIYLAISSIERGMEDMKKNGKASTSYDQGGNNDIKLADFNKCGAVYQLDIVTDETIKSDYVAKNMSGLVVGRPVTGSKYSSNPSESQVAAFATGNKCHIDGIANPDNVTYMSGYDRLIIGEDTGSGHQNDVIWSYHFETKKLTRIQTTPYGAETTSPYWYPNINGWAYLTSVIQHPYGESDRDKDTKAGEARAYTGYIGPFPAAD